MTWTFRCLTLTCLTGMILISAASSADNSPAPSPQPPNAVSTPSTRQVAELVFTASCIKSITLAHDGSIHVILDEHGKPTDQFYFEGRLAIAFVEDRHSTNCDISNNVARLPIK